MSASDILQQSAIHGPVQVEKEAKKKKKKSKKKAKKEASADLITVTTTTSKATVGKQEKESAKFNGDAVSYTHLTLPTTGSLCRSRWSPYH